MNNVSRPITYLLLLSLCFLLPLLGTAQTEKQFTPTELKADLKILKTNMEAIHTALYYYYPKDSIDYIFKTIENQLNEPKTALEFYRLLRPSLKYIANGHTDYYTSKTHVKALAEKLPRFPLDVYWDKDRLFVVRNMSAEEKIQAGDIIHTVNEQPVKKLIDYFASQMTRDGYNESLPYHTAGASFKTYYALLVDTPATFELEMESQEGEKYRVQIKGSTLTEIRDKRREKYKNLPKSIWATKEPTYTLSINNQTALMTLRTFGKSWVRKTTGKSHKRFFKDSFEKMNAAGVEHLILDLRGNGGGDPEPTIALFSHLYPKKFDFYKDMALLVNRIPNAKLYDGQAKLLNLFAWARVKKKKEGGYYAKSLKKYNNNKPAKSIYSGKLYVLTDPLSFSATGEMTAILKNYNRGIFIGEEPGGNPITNTSGVMLPLVLPNTQVRAILPVVQFVMAVDLENTGHGVQPDHFVKNSIEDVLNGRDAVMDFTNELIDEQNK